MIESTACDWVAVLNTYNACMFSNLGSGIHHIEVRCQSLSSPLNCVQRSRSSTNFGGFNIIKPCLIKCREPYSTHNHIVIHVSSIPICKPFSIKQTSRQELYVLQILEYWKSQGTLGTVLSFPKSFKTTDLSILAYALRPMLQKQTVVI